MGGVKKIKRRYQHLRKYSRIVSYLVKDSKKKKIAYTLADIRQQASSIYPNFKYSPYSKITKRAVSFALLIQGGAKIKRTPPTFPTELSDPNERYYFGVYDLLILIQNETLKDDNLFFNSDIAGQEQLLIQGGAKLEPDAQDFYRQNFKNLINFLDKQRKENKFDYQDLRIIATPPVWEKDKWISTITFVDSEGKTPLSDDLIAFLSEYNPKEQYIAPPPPKEPLKSKITPSKLSPSDQLEMERIRATENINIERIKSDERIKLAQTELELFRLKKMEEYYQDALAGKIDWDRHDKLVDMLFKK